MMKLKSAEERQGGKRRLMQSPQPKSERASICVQAAGREELPPHRGGHF